MKHGGRSLLLGSGVFVGLTIASVGGQQVPAGTGAYTPAQAEAGRAAYLQQCAGCHQPDLRGSGDAPALTGPDFRAKWGPQAVNDLFTHIVRKTMPPTNPGSLGERGTLEVTAYLLQINGAPAGQQPLTATVSTAINAVLTEQPRTPGAATAADRADSASTTLPILGAGTGAGQGRGGASANRGVTVHGEVKNYVPVTAEMLQESAGRRLADVPRQLSGLELQPAESDHARQREGSAARVGLGDERLGRQPDDADRAQRHHLSGQPEQHRAGARWQDRRSDLGNARRSRSGAAATAAIRSIAICRRQDLPAGQQRAAWSRSTRGTARFSGTRRSPIAQAGTSTPAARSSIDDKVLQGLTGCGRVRRRWLLHQRVRHRRPASTRGGSTPSRAKASPAATRGASCR